MVSLCGQKGVLLLRASHFCSEVTHEGAQFSTHHSRGSSGGGRCQSLQRLGFRLVKKYPLESAALGFLTLVRQVLVNSCCAPPSV